MMMLYMKKTVTIFILLICNSLVYADSVEKERLLSLLRLTGYFITSGNYERAGELREQSIMLFRKLGAENDSNTISELHEISHAYSEKKMFGEAVKTESILVEVFPIAMPDNKLDYALYLCDLSLYLSEDNNNKLAEKCIKKALSLIKNENDSNSAIIYFRAAEIYQETTPKRNDLSIKYQKKTVDIYAKIYGRTSSEYLDELWYLARYYENAGDYGKACNAYLEILHTRVGDDSDKDKQSFLPIPSYYENAEDFDEACNAFLDILYTRAGDDNDNNNNMQSFLPILDRIIICSRKANNIEQEKQYKRIAYSIKQSEQNIHIAKYSMVEFPSVKDSIIYSSISGKYSYYNEQLDQSKKDGNETKSKQIQEEMNKYLATLPDTYGKAYFFSIETARNSMMYNSRVTIEYGIEALRIFDSLGIKNYYYVNDLCFIADAYNKLDNPAKAYDYMLRAYELRDDFLSFYNICYNGIIRDLALFCSRLGNYREALRYGKMAVEAAEPYMYLDNSSLYFNSLNNLASYYGETGQYEKRLKTMQYLINRAEELSPDVLERQDSPFLFNLADSFLENGDIEKCIETGLRVKKIREKYGDKSLLSQIYHLLAGAYRQKGALGEALYFAYQANIIQKEIGRDDNLSLSNSYMLLARIYKDMGRYDETEKMARCSVNLVYNNIVRNFTDLSSNDRASYWNNYSDLFNIWYPNIFYQSQKQDATELYNKCALFAKGILLNTDIEMSKLIIRSGDNSSLEKYEQYLFNKSVLSKFSSSENPKTKVSVDSLRTVIDKLERELIKECKVYGDYTASMRTTWEDVQCALDLEDIAVEFLSFPLLGDNDTIHNKTLYAAITLKKNDTAPHFIVLFEETELDKLDNNLYNNKLYDLIWGPLEESLSGINNVYFSPAGKLHCINIEVLPEIVDRNKDIHFYRVSSTRLLPHPLIDKPTTKEEAIIFGGLNYDTSITELIADSKLHTPKESSYRGSIENIDLRSGWDYLPETLIEANEIEAALKNSEIPTKTFTDVLGTEASFKSFDGEPCKIIHIATHGFYYTESDSVKMKRENIYYMANQIDKNYRSYKEDNSLTRSGLLMAGCNNIIRGYRLPSDIDDGILYAKEIADMNLNNVELTTLSTCDSGLGDVTVDGVFGLQRAFKKAGVQSILMSLLKVDDEATRIMMVEFYKNLMNGKSKHQSLKDAQKYLKEVENGKYNDPKYWASFIMLDGLD